MPILSLPTQGISAIEHRTDDEDHRIAAFVPDRVVGFRRKGLVARELAARQAGGHVLVKLGREEVRHVNILVDGAG